MEIIMAENIKQKAYEAWWYLKDHDYVVDFSIAKINPSLGFIDDDKTKNTLVQYWLEAGLSGEHEIALDCGAETIEEALIIMAEKLKNIDKV